MSLVIRVRKPGEVRPRRDYRREALSAPARVSARRRGRGGGSGRRSVLPGCDRSGEGGGTLPRCRFRRSPREGRRGECVLQQRRKAERYEDVTSYNNFYEFGTDKTDPAKKPATSARAVGGHGGGRREARHRRPRGPYQGPALEERVYRHSLRRGVVDGRPWIGFPLSDLLKRVEPTAEAKFVAFRHPARSRADARAARADPRLAVRRRAAHGRGDASAGAARVGMYGETLPNQDGAPVRLVVPWKYGFKSIKSIVAIRFVEKQPPDHLEHGSARTSTASTRT